jgi:hypothetical protein
LVNLIANSTWNCNPNGFVNLRISPEKKPVLLQETLVQMPIGGDGCQIIRNARSRFFSRTLFFYKQLPLQH